MERSQNSASAQSIDGITTSMQANHHHRDFWRRGRGPRRPFLFGRNNNTWKEQLLTAAIAAASFAIWYGTPVSNWITDLLLVQIPIEQDVMLGQAALRGFDYQTAYDSYWTPLVQSVGRELVHTYRRETKYDDPYQWHFAIVRADFINAFALPGGTIRVTSALLQTLKPSRAEVAALLGHEMGHVLHRHSQARILQHQLLQNVLEAVLSDDSGGASGGRTRETFGHSLGKLLYRSAQWLGDQRFSRRDEYQADATSWDLLVLSDRYNPQALHSLLAKLGRQEDEYGKGPKDHPLTRAISEWSRTHPATKDRLKALDQKWKALPTQERRRLTRYAT